MATEKLEKLKLNRKTLRTSVTKFVNVIESSLKNIPTDLDSLEETLSQLKIKSSALADVDKELEPLIPLNEYEVEKNTSYEYSDKISLSIFRAEKKLKENTVLNSDISSSEQNVTSCTNSNKFVKLPKLIIPKFSGDCTQYTSFWNTFKVTIHENNSLSKIEKFNYLRSYLTSTAFNAIEGLEISETNYEAAIKILENRFGQKDMIINIHMNKLLNLTPVYKSSDIFGLKKMHEKIETNVRALSALGLEDKSYSAMLIAVILKILPSDLSLDWNRKNTHNQHSTSIQELLDFIQTEIISRERTFATKNKFFEQNKNKTTRDQKSPVIKARNVSPFSSTHEFITNVENKSTDKKCLFCKNNHGSELCEAFDVEKRKNILKEQGRCFLCLQAKHRIIECTKNVRCKICGFRHSEVLCFKRNNSTKKEKKPELETETKSEIVSTVSHTGKNRVCLQTCCVKIKNKKRNIVSRLLLDCGSMRSFLCQSVADKLNLDVIRKEKLAVFTFGSKNPIEKSYNVVKITLENKNSPESKIDIEALITDEICGSNIPPPPELNEVTENKYLQNLTLSDSPTCEEPISLLVGADHYYDIVLGNIKRINKKLVAVQTIFGWCLQGTKSENRASLAMNIAVEENSISEQIKKFWDLETSGLIDSKEDFDSSENKVLKQFESEIKYENARYEIKLPWKLDKQKLDNNRKIAEARFLKLKKRFLRNPELFFEYRDVLQNYLKEGIIEPVFNEEKECVSFYLPHREVIKRDRATSKLRIVFDASSHDLNCISLNNCLHVGPNLYEDIFCILFRFRFNSVAFTADMKQAFLQIVVQESDRNVTRFLFTEDPFNDSTPLQTFRFTRVLFGLNSSPFLLAATIKHHLRKFNDTYPETVNFLNENIYVDDIIGSHPSVEKALSTSMETIDIFQNASMQLHKWHTNSRQLHELWVKNRITSDSSKTFEETDPLNKVLGLGWDNLNDTLYFDTRDLITFVSKSVDTKRFVLQVLGRIFDPIGFLGPFTVRIKCLMQKIWSTGLDWDDTLPEDLKLFWESWCEEILLLSDFRVPRYYFSEIPNYDIGNLQLHLFSDASMKAFGAVAYFRITTPDREIKTAFVASKNRVAPLKSLTVPRLELMGALLSAKLCSNILKALKFNIPCFYWTDSKITYFWIRGSPEKFKPFVKNRIEEIHKYSAPSNWHHCPGAVNPADFVSRGAKISKLINDKTWLFGPEWLSHPPEFWPKSDKRERIDVSELEYNKKSKEIFQNECIVDKLENPIEICKYSNLEKLLRVTAWVKRFVINLKGSIKNYNPLTAEEIIDAENFLVRCEQRHFFKEEYETLKSKKSIKKESSLFSYMPHLDENELLRLGGRLEFCDLPINEKHPLILARDSWLTTLIVRREHNKAMHGGIATTLTRVRSNYWIPKGRQFVKKIVKSCIICRKYRAKPADQLTAPLPSDRTHQTPVFSVCGLDFAGPLYVKNSSELKKSYIVLFTCGVSRALHLELVSDMTTESFLLAFRRFLARRGNCRIIYSDNAKTFQKGKKEIEKLSNILSNSSVQDYLTKEKIIWKNIIERSPWWGGFYERLVKSVKECLHKILGKALLNFEEMTTVLTEIEAVLNLRPLSYVYGENDEPDPLTPMHFLNYGQNQPTYPITFAQIIESGSEKSSLLKRRKYQILLLKQLWKRWKDQYLLDLRTAHSVKNPNSHTEFKVGDIVLVEGNTKNKLLWKLGKIEKALPGRDNKIRCYELKTSGGLLRRTVQHLYPFEL